MMIYAEMKMKGKDLILGIEKSCKLSFLYGCVWTKTWEGDPSLTGKGRGGVHMTFILFFPFSTSMVSAFLHLPILSSVETEAQESFL